MLNIVVREDFEPIPQIGKIIINSSLLFHFPAASVPTAPKDTQQTFVPVQYYEPDIEAAATQQPYFTTPQYNPQFYFDRPAVYQPVAAPMTPDELTLKDYVKKQM